MSIGNVQRLPPATAGDGISSFEARHTRVTGISTTALDGDFTMPAFKANFTNATVIVQFIDATPCKRNGEVI